MKNRNRSHLYGSLVCLVLFLLWTAAVRTIDVRPIGPEHSPAGFASLNSVFHQLTGVHMNLYFLTDWLSLIPVFIMIGFAGLGLVQWLRRRSLFKVNSNILLMGVFYISVFAFYLLFEQFPVNYRPVLIDGFLEASYPSSTTLLVLTILPAAAMQAHRCIRCSIIRKTIILFLYTLAIFMVLGRLISGVHWLTDIIGGILLSISLLEMYVFFSNLLAD